MNNKSYKMPCFKLYDIRGKIGEELNPEVAYRIGRAYALHFKPKTIVVGGDVRLTSDSLKQSLAAGLTDSGVHVIDLGLTGTEEIYHAAFTMDVDGGIEVTASHNPIDYNGMKLVGKNAVPVSGNNGLREIQSIAENGIFPDISEIGTYTKFSNLQNYIEHLLTYIALQNIRPLRLVVNSGNGAAGHVIDEIEKKFSELNVPIEFIKIHHDADGNFPNGIPNPLLPECRSDTSQAVIKYNADMGIAWDGDFDRCFMFDECGRFIEGYYIVGLLAESFLAKYPGQRIIHDTRLVWNTQDIIVKSGGIPVMSKTGHAFIKERMRHEDAIYGGEMSAHHYFRDFAYCDSGMIPWLLVTELLSIKGMKLSETVDSRIELYPSSGEINMHLNQPEVAVESLKQIYKKQAIKTDELDGLSLEFSGWRFNLRSSNTEPVVRLNVESRNNNELMQIKTREVMEYLKNFS
ncbi:MULTISPECIES: phosphomannomutase CpsG [Rahnella]|uniref:Phosphomannomutase n=1 Tax=Rahnella laticis TaxID=2787622 RepID=A0ABS0E5A3_9GAMM|nr:MULTISPECIES: phosphomannomutase CpsG [Rahnella]MBF7980252.1 phosphomannomutase CpsG [Rahnella laticis]MBF8000489.1 phosphomannomutase CpsG [Rahnella sp. LAC-M12]